MLLLTLFLSANTFASTFCGQFTIDYIDHREGGSGALYTLAVVEPDGAEEMASANTTRYTLDPSSKNSTIQTLRNSILGLMMDGKNYCVQGEAVGSTLPFTSVSLER